MDWAAAAIGAVPGLAALGWNTYTWRQSGPRVKVRSSFAMPIYGSEVGDPQIAVEAVNKGRAPVTITGWGIGLPGNRAMVVMKPLPATTALPHRLEPHSSAPFYIEVSEIQAGRRQTGVPFSKMRPYVTLATGAKTYGKDVPLDESWWKG